MKPLRSALAVLILVLPAAPCAAQVMLLHGDRDRPSPSLGPAPPGAVLRGLEIDARLRDAVVSARLTMRWFNPAVRDQEGVLLVPVPPGASVSGFRCTLDGEEVRGEILDRRRARGIYEEIVRRRRDPALLEYAGAGLLRVSLFPLRARKEARVEIRYEGVLAGDAAGVTYRHPLPPRGAVPGDRFDLRIGVEVEGSAPLGAIYSPTHRVEVVREGPRRARVILQEKGFRPGGDFLLYVTKGGGGGIDMQLWTHRRPGEPGTFLLLLAPPPLDAGERPAPKDLVLVLDASGSMAGEKMEQARGALRYVLQGLHRSDRFGVVAFATEARPLAPALLDAGPKGVARALAFVDGLEAAGGTNIRDALLAALRLGAGDERPLYVVFLTDGKPTVGVRDVARILEDVHNENRMRARLFVFGVGSDVNTFLLDRLAESNRGGRDYVAPGEDIEVRVSSLYRKIASPALEAPELLIEGPRVHDLVPSCLPDLFHGTRLLVTGRYDGAGEGRILLRGTARGKPVSYEFRGAFPAEAGAAPFLPRLWATRRVGSLLDEIRLHGADDELIDEVIRLGKRYGIVTPYTSSLVRADQPPGAPGPRASVRTRLGALGYAPGSASGPVFRGRKAVEESRLARTLSRARIPGAPSRSSDADGAWARELRTRADKTFVLRHGVWVDTEVDPGTPGEVKEVVAFSEAYFLLARHDPRLARYLSVGTPALLRYGGVTYRIVGR